MESELEALHAENESLLNALKGEEWINIGGHRFRKSEIRCFIEDEQDHDTYFINGQYKVKIANDDIDNFINNYLG